MLTFIIIGFILLSVCSKKTIETVEIMHYPIDSMKGIITANRVSMDKNISSDGNGSLKITTNDSTTIRLYETGNIDIENAKLIYKAKLRTEKVQGEVFIEMYCHFPGKGEFFSRAFQSYLSGSNNWTSQETPFFLQKGENPDNVKINLIINGQGTVWVDDIRLIKAPLK